MYKIKTLNKISKKGLGILGKNYEISDDCENPDGIILRSFKMHDMELPESLRAVARAGAGVNNIPLDKCSEKGIVVFNTPGANANAVKEIVICSLLLSSRKVVQGINWAKTLKDEGDQAASLVEKGKSNFVGPEIYGKTLGVVGLGAIGVKVANAAHHLGMKVVGYDPYLSVDSAWHLTRFAEKATSFDDLLAQSDYITIHVPALPSTIGMFNSEAFAKMKKGARLLNFSRDTLVDTTDIQAALEDGTVSCYVTGEKNGERMTVAHKNVPNMLKHITDLIAAKGVNIDTMLNKSRGDYAYTMLDLQGKIDPAIAKEIEDIDGVIKVTLL